MPRHVHVDPDAFRELDARTGTIHHAGSLARRAFDLSVSLAIKTRLGLFRAWRGGSSVCRWTCCGLGRPDCWRHNTQRGANHEDTETTHETRIHERTIIPYVLEGHWFSKYADRIVRVLALLLEYFLESAPVRACQIARG